MLLITYIAQLHAHFTACKCIYCVLTACENVGNHHLESRLSRLYILDCLQVFAMSLIKITKSSLLAPVADHHPVYIYQVSYHIIYSLHCMHDDSI